MDARTAEILWKMNNDFYARHAAAFARTRQRPWPGWGKCLDAAGQAFAGGAGRPKVFDLACGNLRFAAFLGQALPGRGIDYYALDDCDALAAEPAAALPGVRYQSLDVLGVLLGGESLDARIEAPACDLCVCFGFLHHVPSFEMRLQALSSLLRKTRPGGYAAVSLWRFLDDPGMRAKAVAAQAGGALARFGLAAPPGGLEPGDCLLGWENEPGAYRYCHSFTQSEIDRLAQAVGAQAEVAAAFRADGRGGAQNSYLVFKARPAGGAGPG